MRCREAGPRARPGPRALRSECACAAPPPARPRPAPRLRAPEAPRLPRTRPLARLRTCRQCLPACPPWPMAVPLERDFWKPWDLTLTQNK
ncbi:hypothetical protein VULLAG_LOCUS15203 [Vulpes lagopus]